MLIDLSHPLVHGQPNFPFDPKISVVPHHTIAVMDYNMTQISMATHQGTHLDAPFHFYDEGTTVDQMPLDQFYGPATLVDLSPGGALDAGTELTVAMFEAHADAFQPGARVIFRTGWDRHFGTYDFFSNFPTVTPDAARWIASRRIAMIGMDTPTPSADWLDVHRTWLDAEVEILIVESLTNLAALPTHFTFIGFPLKIAGRDGSPIRAVAVVGDPA